MNVFKFAPFFESQKDLLVGVLVDLQILKSIIKHGFEVYYFLKCDCYILSMND